MRPSLAAFGLLSLLLVVAPHVRAQDGGKKDDGPKKEKGDEGDDDDAPKPDEKLPFNPFKNAKKGDWSCCQGIMKASIQGRLVDKKTIKVILRVKDVTKDAVTCGMTEKTDGPGGGEREVTFSLAENPGFAKYMSGEDNADDLRLEDWKTEDDKKTVGGKEFACKRVTAKTKDSKGTDSRISIWISQDTKGWGCIALSVKAVQKDGEMLTLNVELKGYGNGDTVDFGKKPEDDAPKK